MNNKTSIYFEAQTGTIREQPPSVSNFHQYRVSPADRAVLEAAVSKAKVGSGSLEYEAGFVAFLDLLERKHLRQVIQANSRIR